VTTILQARPRQFVSTPAVDRVASRALRYLQSGYSIHLRGPAGTGKTTLALHLADLLGRPIMLLFGDDEFKTSDLIGNQSGYTRKKVFDNFIHSVVKMEDELRQNWVDSRLTLACREGFTLVYDEFNRSRPEVNNVLLSALEEKLLVLPPNGNRPEYVRVNPHFRAIFTSNPAEYCGVHATQDALLDRLITMNMPEPDVLTQEEILVQKIGVDREDAHLIVQLVKAFRAATGAKDSSGLRSCLMLGKICHEHDIPILAASEDFRDVCQDVLLARSSVPWNEAQQILWQLCNALARQGGLVLDENLFNPNTSSSNTATPPIDPSDAATAETVTGAIAHSATANPTAEASLEDSSQAADDNSSHDLTANGHADKDYADNGPADNGPADNGPADNGPADNGPADNGPADNGPADNGHAHNSPADNGPADNGHADNSHADNATADQTSMMTGLLDWDELESNSEGAAADWDDESVIAAGSWPASGDDAPVESGMSPSVEPSDDTIDAIFHDDSVDDTLLLPRDPAAGAGHPQNNLQPTALTAAPQPSGTRGATAVLSRIEEESETAIAPTSFTVVTFEPGEAISEDDQAEAAMVALDDDLDDQAEGQPHADSQLDEQITGQADVQSDPISFTEGAPYEREIYAYLLQYRDVRPSQIEAALGITRLQTVSALRSLSDRGLLSQFLTDAPRPVSNHPAGGA